MQKQVTLGENTYAIQRFKGLKAILAIAAVTRIGREVPDIMADVSKEFTKKHTITVTKEMSRLPRWALFTDKDFSDGPIEVPNPPEPQDVIMSSLPRLLEEARKEVIRLLAILVIPNAELKAADQIDAVDEALDKFHDTLLYEAEIDEIAELCLAAADVLQDQLKDRGSRLGKLMGEILSWWTKLANRSRSIQPEAEETSISPTLENELPTSSSNSEQPSAGTGTPSSMTSAGASS